MNLVKYSREMLLELYPGPEVPPQPAFSAIFKRKLLAASFIFAVAANLTNPPGFITPNPPMADVEYDVPSAGLE